jgi:2-methylcitrate dehydratase PrpD
VTLKNGKIFVKELAYPRGDYRLPFTDEELVTKFHSLAEPVLEKSKRDRAIELALNFRKANVKELMAACAGTGSE